MGKLNCSHNFLCHAEVFKGKDKIVGSWLIGCEAKVLTSFALNIWKTDIKNVFLFCFCDCCFEYEYIKLHNNNNNTGG